MGYIEEQLFGAMERVAKQVIEKNGADLTVNGEVIKIVNVEIGEYKVKYEGNIFSAYSETPTTVYQQGDDVYVLVPGANFNNKKIILGHSSYENSTTHTDMTEMTNKYIPLGPNWLSPQWYRPYYPDGNDYIEYETDEEGNQVEVEVEQRLGICAAKDVLESDDRDKLQDDAKFTAYGFARDKDNYIPDGEDIWNPYDEGILTPMTQDQLDRVDGLLQSYAATADYLMIKADFQTEFIDTHNQGEYYLVVEVLEESPEYIDIHTELERLEKESEKYRTDSDKFKEYQSRISYYKEKLAALEPDQYELNEYRLGFGAFIGQPYNYPVSTPNTAYLKITPGAIRGLAAVYLAQDGYLEADKKLTIEDGRPVYKEKQLERNNIFADNIVIQFARKVNLLDNMYYSWIEAPRGDTLFIKKDKDKNEVADLTQKEVTLKARLFYGYEDVMDEEDCQVYWMREYPEMTAGKYEEMDAYLHNPQPNWKDYPSYPEHATAAEIYEDPGEDASQYEIDSYNYTIALRAYEEWSGTVDEWSKTYYNYTGPGWIPVEWLNEKDIKENGKENTKDRRYTINFDELTVPFYAVPVEWRYRAVIVYKGSVRTSDPITVVYNSITGFHFDIQQFNDSDLMKEYLRIQDLDYPQDRTKMEGNISSGTAPVKYAEEFGRWFMSLSDGSYFEITTDGESGEILNKPPEQKGILRYIEVKNPDETVRKTTILDGPKHITNYLINTLIDFNIAVYRNNEVRDGLEGEDLRYTNFKEYFGNWPQDEPICNLTYQVVTEEGLDLLVTWKGQDTFVYNSDGTLMGYNNQEPEKNYILTFEMKWLDGNGENYFWQVFGPGRIPLENGNHVNSFEKSMMKNMWTPDMSKEINFQVEKDYDNSKTENYIILQISTYTGKTWEIRKDLVFIKNGEQGSNGSAWFAPIYPANFRNGTERNMVAFEEPVITQQKPIHVSGDDLDSAVQAEDTVFTNANGEILISDSDKNINYNRLVIRPFITKLGTPIEQIEEVDQSGQTAKTKKYTYKIFWDVRYPINSLNKSEAWAGNSGLRLHAINVIENSGSGDDYIEFDPNPVKISTISSEHQPDDITEDGLIAQTEKNDVTKGAIEVRFMKPFSVNGKTPTFEECHYNFYVKAIIDIFEYYEDAPKTQSKITTLTSYYPVDILLEIPKDYSSEIEGDQTDYNIKIDDRKLNITWPKNIKYNVTGYQPQTTRDELIFEYIDENYSSGRLAPESLYPKLLQIRQNEKNEFDENGELVSTGEYSYYASPRNYTFWGDNYHPVLKASWSIKHSQVTADALNLTYEEKAWYEALKKYFELVNSKNVAQYRYSAEYKNWFDANAEKYLNELNQAVKEIEDRELIFDQNGNILAKPDGDELLNSFEYYRTVIYDLDIYGGNMAINGWDGTRIDINQDQGTIFAPTIGAGYKDPFKNTFTGVIMGIDSSQSKNNSTNYAKFPTDEVNKNEYMTGLYGYQDGVISFGIMENGTAFFGRADRGGRIVIDGHNAQIYGGLIEDSDRLGGDRDMDMSNRMRLSFIDFDGISLDNYISTEDNNILVLPIKDDDGKIIKTVEIDLNNAQRYKQVLVSQKISDLPEYQLVKTYEEDSNGDYICYKENNESEGKYYLITDYQNQIKVDDIDIVAGAFNVKDFATYFQPEDATNLLASVAGFGSGRGYSTPAIEIGSYENYLLETTYEDENRKPSGQDLIREITIKNIKTEYRSIKDLEIPGYRKFLVTYDGTMYAMNAFIKGNLVSSNIIGSQFFNKDGSFAVTEHGNLGIGSGRKVQEEIVNSGYSETWSYDTPSTRKIDAVNYLKTSSSDEFEASDYEQGQYAFYVSSSGKVICNEIHIAGGSLNIGDFHIIGDKGSFNDDDVWTPNENLTGGDVVSYGTLYLIGKKGPPWKGEITDGSIAVQGWGDFYLRGKMVNLGEVLLGGTVDKAIPGTDNKTEEGYNWDNYLPTYKNSPFSLKPTKRDSQYNFISYPLAPIRGSFWPLSFYIGSAFNDAWKGKKETYTNDLAGEAWFGLPIGNKTEVTIENKTEEKYSLYTEESDYNIPVFAYRDTSMVTGDEFNFYKDYPIRTMFRVDSNGLWTDLIFFQQVGDKETADSFNTKKLTDPKVALGYIMGKKIKEGTTETEPTYGFGIKNIDTIYTQMIFETNGDLRASAMKGSAYLVSDTNNVFLDAKQGIFIHGQSITFEIVDKDDKAVSNPWDYQKGIYARFG